MKLKDEKATSFYAQDEKIWRLRTPTDAEVTARFADSGLTDPYTTFPERCGDQFLEWVGPSVPDELLLIAAGAATAMGMSDGPGVSVVRAGGKAGLYFEE